jgi:homoserine kinase
MKILHFLNGKGFDKVGLAWEKINQVQLVQTYSIQKWLRWTIAGIRAFSSKEYDDRRRMQ